VIIQWIPKEEEEEEMTMSATLYYFYLNDPVSYSLLFLPR
jgi:hypothetical protein